MTMVKKWFGVKNTVTTINTPVIKDAKQLTGAVLLLKTITGGEIVGLSYSQKKYMIKIRIMWHEI